MKPWEMKLSAMIPPSFLLFHTHPDKKVTHNRTNPIIAFRQALTFITRAIVGIIEKNIQEVVRILVGIIDHR